MKTFIIAMHVEKLVASAAGKLLCFNRIDRLLVALSNNATSYVS